MIPSLSNRLNVNMDDISAAIQIIVSKHENGLLQKNLDKAELEMNVARNSFIESHSGSMHTPKSICSTTLSKLQKFNNIKLKVFEPMDSEVLPLL